MVRNVPYFAPLTVDDACGFARDGGGGGTRVAPSVSSTQFSYHFISSIKLFFRRIDCFSGQLFFLFGDIERSVEKGINVHPCIETNKFLLGQLDFSVSLLKHFRQWTANGSETSRFSKRLEVVLRTAQAE